MPQRTNTFQEVVSIIQEHMAGKATVDESAMLPSRITGELREVDVAIRSRIAGHEVIVSVEATATKRKADTTWVEKTIGKHDDLPTSELVLVSQAGFTEPARKLAETKGATALEPKDLEADDPDYAVLSRLPSLWQKQVTVTTKGAQLNVETASGKIATVGNGPLDPRPLDAVIFLDNQTEVGTLGEAFMSWAREGGANDLVRYMAEFSEDTERSFVVRFEAMEIQEDDDTQKPLYVKHPADGRLASIGKSQFVGHVAIRVAEIPLRHQRLGDVAFSYGEGQLGSHRVLGVVTLRGVTLRLRPKRSS